jgi:hypothetical protein
MRWNLLLPLLTTLSFLACSGKSEEDETIDESDADTDADSDADADADADSDADADADPLATLTGDDAYVARVWWTSSAFDLALTAEALTGTMAYSERDPDDNLICEGTLSLTGLPDAATACEDLTCVWGYTLTAAPETVSGTCAYPIIDSALNLADPAAVGFLAYFEDVTYWDTFYNQLMYFGVNGTDGYRSEATLLMSSADGDYGLEAYDADLGTVVFDLGRTGVSRPAAYTGDCEDLSFGGAVFPYTDSPLQGTIDNSANFFDDLGDIWSIELADGQSLRALLKSTDGEVGQIRLITPEGCRAVESSWEDCPDAEADHCEVLAYSAPAAGTYQVIVTGDDYAGDDVFGYDLHLVIE